MVSFLPPPVAVDNVTLQQSASGVVSIKNAGVDKAQLATTAFDGTTIAGGAGVAAAVVRPVVTTEAQAFGSSSSGTPGTAICSLPAVTGFRYNNVFLQAENVSGATSQFVITVTYDDNSTETYSSPASATEVTFLGGVMTDAKTPLTLPVLQFPGMATKSVKSVAATTAGAGVVARVVAMRAQLVVQ